MASIALRQFQIRNSPFAHNYLVFYDDDGNIVGQFHGLAQDPKTGYFKGVGRSSDYLTIVPDDPQKLYSPGQPERVLWQGSHDEGTSMGRETGMRRCHQSWRATAIRSIAR